VPISLDALDVSLMDASDIERLNNYHEEVYKKISPLLESNEEKEWLRKATASVAH
jgi:Xaa-Pro aminopeptidase